MACDLRASIRERLSYTCCAGISFAKPYAKLAGGLHKPDQQTMLFPAAVASLVGFRVN